MKNILITGGAGYIGSATAQVCAERGHTVTVLDSDIGERAAALPEGATLIEGDILDTELLEKVFAEGNFDVVMHLAALKSVEDAEQQPERYHEVNVAGTEAILTAMHAHGVSHMVFASSAAVYGEGQHEPYTEQSPCKPVGIYAETKYAAEQVIQRYVADGLVPRATLLRYFNVAGNSHYTSPIYPQPQTLFGAIQGAYAQQKTFMLNGNDYDTPDGTCIRDCVHVDDIARAQCLVAEQGDVGVYNLGSGSGYSIKEVLAVFENVYGVSLEVEVVPRRAGDVAYSCADIHKVESDLKWHPQYTLEDIVCSLHGVAL